MSRKITQDDEARAIVQELLYDAFASAKNPGDAYFTLKGFSETYEQDAETRCAAGTAERDSRIVQMLNHIVSKGPLRIDVLTLEAKETVMSVLDYELRRARNFGDPEKDHLTQTYEALKSYENNYRTGSTKATGLTSEVFAKVADMLHDASLFGSLPTGRKTPSIASETANWQSVKQTLSIDRI